MSKTNLSSDGIVRHRACAVCVDDQDLLLVLLKDPATEFELWTPPGGGIEPGESSLAAALRETREETGYEIEPVTDRTICASYHFVWDRKRYLCHTEFHLCRLAQSRLPMPVVQDAAYLKGVAWMAINEVNDRLSYHPEIQAAVAACLAVSLAVSLAVRRG